MRVQLRGHMGWPETEHNVQRPVQVPSRTVQDQTREEHHQVLAKLAGKLRKTMEQANRQFLQTLTAKEEAALKSLLNKVRAR